MQFTRPCPAAAQGPAPAGPSLSVRSLCAGSRCEPQGPRGVPRQTEQAGHPGLRKGPPGGPGGVVCTGSEPLTLPGRHSSRPNPANRAGRHLCLPPAFHILVDISQLVDLFNGRLGGGVQGDNHEVLDSWGAGRRRRSRTSPARSQGRAEGSGCPPRRHAPCHWAPTSRGSSPRLGGAGS